jgi:hypothetical protein
MLIKYTDRERKILLTYSSLWITYYGTKVILYLFKFPYRTRIFLGVTIKNLLIISGVITKVFIIIGFVVFENIESFPGTLFVVYNSSLVCVIIMWVYMPLADLLRRSLLWRMLPFTLLSLFEDCILGKEDLYPGRHEKSLGSIYELLI